MPFYVSLTLLLCALNLAVLAACAQILSRVVRLEAVERARAAFEVLPGIRRLAVGVPVPTDDAPELAGRLHGRVRVHVVSAGCRSCTEHLRGLERRGNDGDLVVVATPDEKSLVERSARGHRPPVLVARALVESTIFSGYELPVSLEIDAGVLTAVHDVGVDAPIATVDAGTTVR